MRPLLVTLIAGSALFGTVSPLLAQTDGPGGNLPAPTGQSTRDSTGAAPAPANTPPIGSALGGATPGNGTARSAGATTGSRSAMSGYPTEAAARQACGSDTVVWGNERSHAFHLSGAAQYGHTKHGAYMCESAAKQAGYHQAGQQHRHRQG